jgi:TetR/AcrR family transcriptional repressor of mexJK operon
MSSKTPSDPSDPATPPVKAPRKTAAKPRSAGRPRAEDVELRAQELLHVAGQLFLKNGYSKVSLEMIAREARVAIRTIYVKFGGKAGIVKALMEAKRVDFLAGRELRDDPRPAEEALRDFAHQFHGLINTPEAQALQRMVMTEAQNEPGLAETFYEAGPGITAKTLREYFDLPAVRAQLREDLPFDQLPVFFINCLIGDTLSRTLQRPRKDTTAQALDARMDLFFRACLR